MAARTMWRSLWRVFEPNQIICIFQDGRQNHVAESLESGIPSNITAMAGSGIALSCKVKLQWKVEHNFNVLGMKNIFYKVII